MDTLSALLDGFANALTLANLGWAFLGVTLGTAIGILPGIGPALTIALLLPLTGHLDPTAAFIMFAGLYYGAMYGSSTTSILLNTPGESGSIITAIEGNLMARQGRGAAALATAAIGSFVAGTIGTLLLTFVAPFVVKIAIKFSPAAYFSLMLLAFTTVSAMLGASLLRGLIALFVGIGIGLVGTDKLTGQGVSHGIPRTAGRHRHRGGGGQAVRHRRGVMSPRGSRAIRLAGERLLLTPRE
jgi:putative tricarboxylic transport membrane protein